MHSTILPFITSFLLLAPGIHAGCYSGDLAFNGLHGGAQDKTDYGSEVQGDINSRCLEVAGRTISKEAPFWKCTEWPVTVSGNENCFEECLDGCESSPGDSGISAALCAAQKCRADCDKGPPTDQYNHIDWAIEIRGGDTAKEISFEKCSEWFNWEHGGCERGSESSHDGFWFRIDPGYGKCS